MKLKQALLWQPDRPTRIGILALIIVFGSLVGYVHMLTGLDYEFHFFFIAPLLVASWFLGSRTGYALSVAVALGWFVADRLLAGEQANLLPLAFNTLVRMAIFTGGSWLVGELRYILLRESRLAREDALTHLPNRREFHERGRQAFAQAQRQSAPIAAVFIDLDRFKEANDTFGHQVGDRLLANVAAIMRGHVRGSDVAGRLGGDEFALLLPNMNADAAQAYVEKLRQSLLTAMQAQGWPVTFSIGVATARVAPADFEGLLKEADALMYEVKRCGRNHVLLREVRGGT